MKKQGREVVVILDNIRSIFNVGSIFRTSDALGVNKIILCGTTPTPQDRFGRDREDISKVALGAEKTIAWEYLPTTILAVKKIKKDGYRIIMIEQADSSVDYKKIKLSVNEKVAFVVGTEVEGLSASLLKLADDIAEIPMRGEKESLNVSVAFGVAMFRILNI